MSVLGDIPSGEVMVTLTYVGSSPAPHSLVFTGLNLEQPVTAHRFAFESVRSTEPLVAVDGPGVNQRIITLPPGTYIFSCAVPRHREAASS